MGQKLWVSEELPFAPLGTQNANAVFALRLGIPKTFFQQIAGIAVTFQGTGDPQTVDIKPACCINGYPCVFCRDVLDKAFAALCTAVKNKSLLKALLEPFFFGEALFAGHGTTDVFPVDVFFGNSDIVHRSTLPYLCTFHTFSGTVSSSFPSVPQSTSPAQRPFRFLLRLIASVHRRPSRRSFPRCSPAGTAESTGASWQYS